MMTMIPMTARSAVHRDERVPAWLDAYPVG